MAEHLARAYLLERHRDIKVCIPVWNKNCLSVIQMALTPSSSHEGHGHGSFRNPRSWEHKQLLQSRRLFKESCLPGVHKSLWINCCSTQDLHQLVQQPSYLLRHLLFRTGQNNSAVFSSPSPAVQRGFKKAKDVGHHSLQEEGPVETLIWVNVTFELKAYYMSKFKFNTIF